MSGVCDTPFYENLLVDFHNKLENEYMKLLLMMILTVAVYQSVNAASLSAIKADKTCYAYALTQEQMEVPFNAFCFDSEKVYFYDKFALYSQAPVKKASKTEKIVKIYKTLPTQGLEPKTTEENLYGIYSLFILTEKGTVIYMDKYNYETEGQFSLGNTQYQYKKQYDLEYDAK